MTYVLTLLLKLLMLLKEMVLLWADGVMDEAHMDVGRVEEVVGAP